MMYNQRHFTIIELLLSIVIIAVLFSMLMPSLAESRARARFVRWLQFNQQCSTDPTCVINLNFQEGEGDTLENSAKGHEAEGFNADGYNGILKGDYEWGQGRWWRGKRAIQFDGVSSYIEFEDTKSIDFDGSDNFTIILWIKFDRLDNWDGVFGKCYMRNEVNGYAQYAVYYDGSKNGKKSSAGQFEADIGNDCVNFEDVSAEGDENILVNSLNWFQLVLRNRMVDEKQEVQLFFNGIRLKSKHVSTKGFKKNKCEARLTIGCIRWLVLENDKPTRNGKPGNFLKGKIDEFLVYSRALTQSEITAHYVMGAEYH